MDLAQVAPTFPYPKPIIMEVTHLVNFNVQRVDNVVVDQFKVLVADPVLYITFPSGEEVVHYNNLMALHHEPVHQGLWQLTPNSLRQEDDEETRDYGQHTKDKQWQWLQHSCHVRVSTVLTRELMKGARMPPMRAHMEHAPIPTLLYSVGKISAE
ncbi:hypothetical protein E2C01_013083 [Portunus trituberculatus]|uniref:Uncharacterized protein n=1 Tax=Portunus trituberculatus TaxID=210409 RepID=A0A5B7DFA7_PORTR|nr:hypothetical protein [Portunus trituberculatus]